MPKGTKDVPTEMIQVKPFCRVKILKIDATTVVDQSGLKTDMCILVHRFREHMSMYDLINLYLLQNMIMLPIC